MADKPQTPAQMAEHEVNKKLGKAIADREYKKKVLQAEIKKLDKEIEKIKSGELVPEGDSSSSSSPNTAVTFLLDESGSMHSHITETISGFNEYVQALQKEKGITFTFTKFNSIKVDVVYIDKPIKSVPMLNMKTYRPDDCTPLYDAIGKTISTLAKKLKTYVKKPKVLFVIMTDGYENTSKEYDLKALKGLIKSKQKEDWSFIFMGADQDAWLSAKDFGLHKGNVMSFSKDRTRGVMGRAGGMSASFASSKDRVTTAFFAQKVKKNGKIHTSSGRVRIKRSN